MWYSTLKFLGKDKRMATSKFMQIFLLCLGLFVISSCVSEQEYRDLKAQNKTQRKRIAELESELTATELKLEKLRRLEEYPEYKRTTKSSSGTGFAVSSKGHIVTSYHVIKEAKTIKVYLTEEAFVSATVLHRDPMNDLAVLKIEKSTPNFLQLAPMRSVKMGDRVFTVGFPVRSVLGREAKYTEGVVSSLSGPKGASSFLQITVPVQPGNSGGPLVNEAGKVVGVITSSAAILPFIQETGTLPQNVNWAVKADYLRPLIELPKIGESQARRDLITYIKEATFYVEAEYH